MKIMQFKNPPPPSLIWLKFHILSPLTAFLGLTRMVLRLKGHNVCGLCSMEHERISQDALPLLIVAVASPIPWAPGHSFGQQSLGPPYTLSLCTRQFGCRNSLMCHGSLVLVFNVIHTDWYSLLLHTCTLLPFTTKAFYMNFMGQRSVSSWKAELITCASLKSEYGINSTSLQ